MLTTTECQLSALSENFTVIFPQRYLQDGILTSYPVIVQELDFTDGETLLRAVCSSLEFTERCFDYLVLMSSDTNGTIARGGLKFPKSALAVIKSALDNDNPQPEGAFRPFPIDITPQIVDCFGPGCEIAPTRITGYEGIDKIAELLWAYAKTQELLTDKRDTQYRKQTEEKLTNEIWRTLSFYTDQIAPDDLESLRKLCENVIEGQQFGNDEMNEFCNALTLVNDQTYPVFNKWQKPS